VFAGTLALALALGGVVLGATPAAAGGDACAGPPVTMRIEKAAAVAAGGAEFEVTHALARRVPIVPDPKGGTTSDPDEIEELTEKARTTNLALYSMYLADFRIPRRELKSFGFAQIEPEPGGTLAVVTIVPKRRKGFSEGDAVRDGNLGYDTTTTFAPLGLVVESTGSEERDTFTDVEGRVKILSLDDDRICLDMRVELTRDGDPVAATEGVVSAPVVRATDSFFFR